jgi:sulfur carrier protein ThiS
MIEIRIGKIPGTLKNLVLNDGSTIADALSAAELARTGFELRVDSANVEESFRLRDGQTVLLVAKIRGAYGDDGIEVRIGKIPGSIRTLALLAGATIADALAAAELSRDGFELRVNSETVDETHELEDGETVLLVAKIRGADGRITEEVVGSMTCSKLA